MTSPKEIWIDPAEAEYFADENYPGRVRYLLAGQPLDSLTPYRGVVLHAAVWRAVRRAAQTGEDQTIDEFTICGVHLTVTAAEVASHNPPETPAKPGEMGEDQR